MSENKNGNTTTSARWFVTTAIFMAVLLCLLACCTVAAIYIYSPDWISLLIPTQPVILTPNEQRPLPSSTPFLPLPTATPTPTPTSTPTPLPTATPLPTPTPIPDRYQVTGLVGNPQLYSLDCESRSAVDWAAFFGHSISEPDFLSQLPKSDDPDSGFVGNFNGYLGQLPPKSYGVHAGPIATLLRAYGVPAQSYKGFAWEQLKAEIEAGRPVIAWVVNYPYAIDTRSYTASNGNTSTVARYEHTWIVTGYDPYAVTVVDSKWTYRINTNDFLARWAALGNMVIIYQ